MKTLTGPQLLLRPFLKTDSVELARLANNKKIADQVRDIFPHPYTEEDAEQFIELQLRYEGAPITFCITHHNLLVGVIGLVPQTDVYRFNAEMGYWLGEPYWGRGFAKEAVGLIVRYAFEELNFRRIYAGVFDFNEASKRVLLANGFKHEAIARDKVFKNGRYRDEWDYALLSTEFQADKK